MKNFRNFPLASLTLAIGSIMAGGVSFSHAALSLYVNVDTGNISIHGATGDTLASYVIYSTSLSHNLKYDDWSSDRFGASSVSNGFGTWHSMGTSSATNTNTYSPLQLVTLSNGTRATYQLGEMCAVWAGFGDGQTANSSTSKIYTFDSTSGTIDLGNHFITGSVEDLVFGYGYTPGFYNGSDTPGSYMYNSTTKTWNAGTDGWIFDGQSHTYTVSKVTNGQEALEASYYYNQTYTSTGMIGSVVYVDNDGNILKTTYGSVPEPATLLTVGIAGAGLVLRRRKSA